MSGLGRGGKSDATDEEMKGNMWLILSALGLLTTGNH